MAAEVDQVAAQELTSQEHASQGQAAQGEAVPPAPHASGAPEPANSPEEAHGTKPTKESTEEEPAPADLPTQQGAPAVATEPTKLDSLPAETVPAGVLANGDNIEKLPQETPTMTGALQDGVFPAASSPSPPNIPDAPAPAVEEEAAEAAEDATPVDAATKTNGKAAVVESIETKAAPAPEAPAEAARAPEEAEEAPQPGDKRKAEEPVPTNREAANKKAKTDEVAAGGPDTNGANGPKKPGRPRKNKDAPPQVGRTARKTRSQGPVEGG